MADEEGGEVGGKGARGGMLVEQGGIVGADMIVLEVEPGEAG